MITMKYTAQKNKFSVKDFFSKCDQILRNLRIWSYLLEKSLMENLIFLCSEISIQEDRNIPYTYSLFSLVTLAVENSRKNLLLVTYRSQAFLYCSF